MIYSVTIHIKKLAMFEPNFSLVDCEIVFGFSLLANGRITGEAGKKKVLLATVSRGPQGQHIYVVTSRVGMATGTNSLGFTCPNP